MTKLDKLLEQQKEIQNEIDKERAVKVENAVVEKNNDEVVNKYMIMPFWDFAILSTLMIAFFPWSLLFCVLFYGLGETKYIVLALFHDFIKTILAVLSIVVPIIMLVIFAVVLLSSQLLVLFLNASSVQNATNQLGRYMRKLAELLLPLSLLVLYFVILFLLSQEYAQDFPVITIIAWISPWMYMLLVVNDFDAVMSILFSLIITTIFVWLSIAIFS